MTSIELISLGQARIATGDWAFGPTSSADDSVSAVSRALAAARTDAVLVLDGQFAPPDPILLARLLDGPADAWHAGLRLGLAGHPKALMHVHPLWMLTAPSNPDHELTSPLISLRALLVRRSVIEQLGGVDPAMETLSGAGLEMGIRWIKAGALVRHVPDLAPQGAPPCRPPSESDGHRCVARHFGRSWAYWALGRAVFRRRVTPTAAPEIERAIRTTDAGRPPFYRTPPRPDGSTARSVSVILPTIDRYSYLEPLLLQLADQTVPPREVIVVDQTPSSHRRIDLENMAPDLPVLVSTLDEPGQSTARNLALKQATSEFVLFLDDDDEIGPELIESHLRQLTHGVDAISGGVDDATAGPPPPGFRHRRSSDVFPAGNSIVRRTALARSGVFDPVFDHGPRADHDLGTRLHLSGAVIVYDPSVMVFHHHAQRGGLRTHKARAVTRASARQSLTARNLPSATELYLGLRYFNPESRREARAIRIISTVSGDGPPIRRIARAIVQIALLPDTLRRIKAAEARSEQLYLDRPPIPGLPDDRSE